MRAGKVPQEPELDLDSLQVRGEAAPEPGDGTLHLGCDGAQQFQLLGSVGWSLPGMRSQLLSVIEPPDQGGQIAVPHSR